MTTKEKIEAIRQACIKVNREREWKDFVAVGAPWKDSPCRLADVLLAIKLFSISITACRGYFAKNGVIPKGDVKWNLRTDDLAQQSEETIDFIYELVKEV